MQVFLSWSGVRSQSVAQALHAWLPFALPGVEPWMSAPSMGPVARWNTEVAGRLEASHFGVLCLTRDSMMAPWVLFEAGALAKALHNARVYTYLFDLEPVDVQGPLAQFKAVTTARESTWELVHSMYSTLEKQTLSEAQLHTLFDKFWPDLETALARVSRDSTPKMRSHRSLLEEILANVRGLSRASYALLERADGIPAPHVRNWLTLDEPQVYTLRLDDEDAPAAWIFDEAEAEADAEVAATDEVVGLEEAHKPAPLLSGLSKPKVLVVEDNENTQFLIQSLLEEDLHIMTTATAEDALLEAFRTEFDMVVMDINLGDGPNGMDLLSELRAMPTYRNVPIVAITAYALPGDRERFLEMGFTDYLAKPFHADDLLALTTRL